MPRNPHARIPALSDADYAAMLAAQDGHCALCSNTPKTRRLHTDHDHKTGHVRGLLCYRCNAFIPTWFTVEYVRGLLAYLLRAESSA
jgi:hypothetical protein